MLGKLRSRLTYANVMATIAVFIALGGSSYAALRITSRNVPKNALTGADIKNLTGKDVTNNSLTGADVRNLSSADVANGRLLAEDFAPGQLPRGEKGETGPTGAAATKLFGNFNGDDGSLVRGSGIISSEKATFSDGTYFVNFDRDISQCALLAAPSSIDGTNPSSVTVGTGYGGANQAFVLVRSDFVDTRVDADFSIAAFC